MNVTPRVLEILRLLRRFKYLTRELIQKWCVPHDKDGSITREIIRKMTAAGLAKRFRAQVVDPLANSTAPVIVPTQAGCSVLATMMNDMSLLLDHDPPPAWQSFSHFVSVSEFLLVLSAAISKSHIATLPAMYLEHDVISNDTDPSKRYRLYSVVQEQPKKIVSVPDALIGIQISEFLTALYLELERGSDSPARVAAKKSQGYVKLSDSGKFKNHLPSADKMRVLAVCPNAAFRDALRKEMRAKPGKDLWRFVAKPDVSVDSIVHSPILYPCEGEPMPLVKPAPVGTAMAEA